MQTTNARDPRPVPPDPTGRETSRAVMGQFSGGCYLSFFIFVLLGSQAPTTLARGKLNTETLFEELSAFGASQSSRINSIKRCMPRQTVFLTLTLLV